MTTEPPVNVTEAFLAGLHGMEFTSVNGDSVIVHLVTEAPGPNLLLFEKIGRWPPSELIDDREAAYRVGRAFRAAAHYLDELGVPLEIGKEIVDSLIRMGKLHVNMHGGRHTFGPSLIIEAVLKDLGPWGAHPQFLKDAGVEQDDLSDAMWAYVRASVREFEPFSRN